MFEGGAIYTKESDKIVRYIGVISTPIFVIHGLLVMYGQIPSTHYVNESITWIILATWLITGLLHALIPIKARSDIVMRLILYQLLALTTMTFITGFFQPFAPAMILPFLAAYLYFGLPGFAISVGSLILTMILDAIIRVAYQPSIFFENAIGLLAILTPGIAVVALVISQETRRRTLIKSQEQERLQYDRILTIINNLTDATFSTDSNGKVQLYNAACLNLLDTNDSLKGQSIGSLFSLTDDEGTPMSLQELLSASQTATRRDDIRHRYQDGEEIRLELTFAPIKSSFGVHKKAPIHSGYIMIARDITKEKSLEEERDEFISVVSHELRTPITIVEGTISNLQVLMSQPKPPTVKTLAPSLNVAHEQVLYLAKMMNDLSALSRAERGVADEAEDIDVQEMLHRLHHEYHKDASAKKLHLNIDLGTKLGTIHASRLYTEELLQNFITNAIKYTHTGSVTINAKRTKDVIRFTVKDTGIGISRSDQAKIFHKFYRSEDYRIRETSGTGLGLYVATKLAHKIGTHINLVSRLNHGSSFSFEMPVKK